MVFQWCYAKDINVLGWYFEFLGIGYCNDGYYAGDKGEGVASFEACKKICLAEEQCRFMAYVNIWPEWGNPLKRCNRYNKVTCNLDSTNADNDAKNYKTFAKTGLSLYSIVLRLRHSWSGLYVICDKIPKHANVRGSKMTDNCIDTFFGQEKILYRER